MSKTKEFVYDHMKTKVERVPVVIDSIDVDSFEEYKSFVRNHRGVST